MLRVVLFKAELSEQHPKQAHKMQSIKCVVVGDGAVGEHIYPFAYRGY